LRSVTTPSPLRTWPNEERNLPSTIPVHAPGEAGERRLGGRQRRVGLRVKDLRRTLRLHHDREVGKSAKRRIIDQEIQHIWTQLSERRTTRNPATFPKMGSGLTLIGACDRRPAGPLGPQIGALASRLPRSRRSEFSPSRLRDLVSGPRPGYSQEMDRLESYRRNAELRSAKRGMPRPVRNRRPIAASPRADAISKREV
jgi:hypothetical protein